MKNKVSTGLIIGLICPPLAFYVFYLLEFRDTGIFDVLRGYSMRNVLTHVISLSVLINLPVFFAFLGSNRELSARGVLGATFIFAFVVLILKLT
jgi:hypothetical protein